jgi:hypothetical protein
LLTDTRRWEIRLRWPVAEGFECGRTVSGWTSPRVRLYTAIARYTVLRHGRPRDLRRHRGLLRDRIDTQASEPARPDQPPPADPGRSAHRPGDQAPPRRGRRPTPPTRPQKSTGWMGGSSTRRSHGGFISTPDSPVTLRSPWAADEWRLPYRWRHGRRRPRGAACWVVEAKAAEGAAIAAPAVSAVIMNFRRTGIVLSSRVPGFGAVAPGRVAWNSSWPEPRVCRKRPRCNVSSLTGGAITLLAFDQRGAARSLGDRGLW